MATYTFNVTRCAGGEHVVIVATEQGGEVIPIELSWDDVRLVRTAKMDYRQFGDPTADIMVELRKQLVASGASTFAQARTVINGATVVI